MQNTFILCLLVIIGLTSISIAQDIVQPSQIVGPLESGYGSLAQGETSDLLFLSFDKNDPDIMSAVFVATSFDSGFDGQDFELISFKTWELNLATQQAEFINEGDRVPGVGELVKDVSSVIINQKRLVLEKSFIPSYSFNFNGLPDPLGHFFHWTFLDRAIESHNQRYIGGSQTNGIHDGTRTGQSWQVIALWKKSSGNLIFLNQPKPQDLLDSFQNKSFESVSIGFSPDDRFFYLREFNQVDFSASQETHTTGVDMINTETFEQFSADKDVAFTNDGRFYVTAVGGVPSLVSTTHGKARQQYNIDGKIMTAAAVSPDDQTLYIATGDDKIYVFPSQLPTSHVEEWEVYE